ncbi:major facilitator superfamily domain-containing protein 8-like [Daphnia pulicaria]|uniref:major facilitator superfamily domain-containing protein 8-like n=1 Tax=Daphnia pulicaria TaxID=35523 RepID=UPI001EEA0D1D|nr:major facilitator superfamily domain-containing protein 8-like [Daphnia pulicaria]
MTGKHNYMWQEEDNDEASVIDEADIFETRPERIRRRISLVIINIVGFISTLGFSIVLTGAYPYLLQIDEESDKRVLGWVIAAQPVGQLLSSPFVGWLGNKFGSVRWLCMTTGLLNMIGFVLYAVLGDLPQPRRYWMIFARFIVGVAAGSVTLCITYISKATTAKERTTFIAINALVSTIGFIVGPAVQSALIPLGTDNLRWNMYTAAGWLAASLTLVQVILFFPCIFQEFNMAEKEANWNKMKNQKKTQRTNNQGFKRFHNTDNYSAVDERKRDLIGVGICIFNFSVAGFILIMIETLATPIAMDQLAYTDDEAVKKVGIVLSIGCILTVISFAASGPLARRITERKTLVLFGLIPLLLCHVVLLPYPGPLPLMQQQTHNNGSGFMHGVKVPSVKQPVNQTLVGNLTTLDVQQSEKSFDANSTTAHLGCPINQKWCLYTPAIRAEQLIFGFMFIAIGYAFTATMSTSTMTQLLPSDGQQGTWTGIYQAGGSLARILGPLYLTNVYTVFGPRATFGSIIAILCGVIVLNLYLFKHLIPMAHRSRKIYFDLR